MADARRLFRARELSPVHPVESVLARADAAEPVVPIAGVPSGFAANGVPTGVRIVGRTSDGRTPFQVDAHERRPLQPTSLPR